MCIWLVVGIWMGVTQEPLCSRLQDCTAPAFDLFFPSGQRGEEVPDPLLHSRLAS